MARHTDKLLSIAASCSCTFYWQNCLRFAAQITLPCRALSVSHTPTRVDDTRVHTQQQSSRQPHAYNLLPAPACSQIRAKLKQLKLSNQAVWDREHAREAAGGGVATPWFVRGAYLGLCLLLDVAFDNRPLQRFWFLVRRLS